MKKKYLSYVIIAIFLFLSILVLSGCTNKDEEKQKDVSRQEVKYIDNEIVSMLNKLNNIEKKLYIQIEQSKENSSQSGESSQGSSGESSNKGESSSGASSEGGTQGGSQSGEQANSQSSSKEESGKQSGSSSQSVENSTKKYTLKSAGILTNDKNDVDWDYIKNNVENLNSIWSSIVINLHQMNIENNDILEFSNKLDNLVINAKNEDKSKTIETLSSLYSYLPKYISKLTDDQNTINLAYTKANIINSYNLVEQEKWDDMRVQISTAQNYFSNIINNVNQDENKQMQYSKIYVLLNEMNNAINSKEKEVYYIKYKNILEYMDNLQK